MTTSQVPLGEYVPEADERMILHGLDWKGFETLIALRGDHRRPRFAYLDGTVELMGASRGHEGIKSVVGRLAEAYCLERDLPFSPFGNWLLKKEELEAGVEPDECYIFSAKPREVEWPHLAIEVVWTSGGIDKLEIYRRLRIGEVWFWQRDEITIFVLSDGKYTQQPRSACLPGLDLGLVARLSAVEPVSEAIKQLRTILRDPS